MIRSKKLPLIRIDIDKSIFFIYIKDRSISLSFIWRKMPMSETTITDSQKMGIKFIRRPDLDSSTRLYIATTALAAMLNHQWGIISGMAQQFKISRTFVYMLASTLTENDSTLFGINNQDTESQFSVFQYMLSLRLEGRCNIQAISTIMKRFGVCPNSTGSISQYLNYFGSILPNTVSANNDETKIVVFLSDEIFSKNTPILVTVDADSSAILRIELANTRSAEAWKNHWQCIEENDIFAAYLVCDEGTGLRAAKKEALPEVVRQSDTYHAIAHVLGSWVERLEKAAYGAIETEDNRFKILDSARSDKVINNRIEQFEKAQKAATEAIALYDSFQFLYNCLIEQLRLFNMNGSLRYREDAEENIKISLDLIDTLGKSSLSAAAKKVRNTLPELFNYFDVAKNIMSKLEQQGIEQNVLRALCLAWQWNRGKVKAKTTDRRQQCIQNENNCLEFTIGHLQEEYENVKEQVYKELNKIVQSSALVECINSIIRPYLDNSKNQITQETLNLIMFYHNHRRYLAGKRKNMTPIEILTGKKQNKDWTELLFEIAFQKDPSFVEKIYST